MTIRVTSGDTSSTSIAPSGPGASRSRISSIDRTCSSCWRVVLVGSHIASRPSAIASRASAGSEPGVGDHLVALERGSTPSGRAAAKNRASNRRGRVGGVTQRESGTSRSVRSRRSRSEASSAKRRVAAEERGPARSDGGRATPTSSARRTPASSNSSRIAAMCAASATAGARSPPSATAASAGESTDRADQRRIRVRRIDPTAGEDVHVRRERHRRRPLGQQDLQPGRPGRSSTTVAAGRGSTASEVKRAPRR